MIEIIASGVIGASIGILGTYVIGKKIINPDRILEIFSVLTNDILRNENSQKEIYALGVLLGNGIKTGIGLNPRGGKMKMEDLIMTGISQFIQGKLGVSQNTQSPQGTLPQIPAHLRKP